MTGNGPGAPIWIDADTVRSVLPTADAVGALGRSLLAGFDPATDPARAVIAMSDRQLLLMPSEFGDRFGVKIVAIAPDHPRRTTARILATYLLCDSDTLHPVAILDGTALTATRTAAVSALAASHLAAEDAETLVVFGSGPQARSHIAAIRAVRPIRHVTVVGRDPARAVALVEHTRAAGLEAVTGGPDAVRGAAVTVCATTARQPVVDGELVDPSACVIAIGSHEPAARELDATVMRRSQVVVEDPQTALREAGDVLLAIEDGELSAADLVSLADVVRGTVPVAGDRPRVFKSVGMSWQDLVVATEIFRRCTNRPAPTGAAAATDPG